VIGRDFSIYLRAGTGLAFPTDEDIVLLKLL